MACLRPLALLFHKGKLKFHSHPWHQDSAVIFQKTAMTMSHNAMLHSSRSHQICRYIFLMCRRLSYIKMDPFFRSSLWLNKQNWFANVAERRFSPLYCKLIRGIGREEWSSNESGPFWFKASRINAWEGFVYILLSWTTRPRTDIFFCSHIEFYTQINIAKYSFGSAGQWRVIDDHRSAPITCVQCYFKRICYVPNTINLVPLDKAGTLLLLLWSIISSRYFLLLLLEDSEPLLLHTITRQTLLKHVSRFVRPCLCAKEMHCRLAV